ncbi:hypothetical protein Btru_075029 [Bulinus truncatus]|nr:hypothetical protein Btru_075029 [Bulinus truncatus]
MSEAGHEVNQLVIGHENIIKSVPEVDHGCSMMDRNDKVNDQAVEIITEDDDRLKGGLMDDQMKDVDENVNKECVDGELSRGIGNVVDEVYQHKENIAAEVRKYKETSDAELTKYKESSDVELTKYKESSNAESTMYKESSNAESTMYKESSNVESTMYKESSNAESTIYKESSDAELTKYKESSDAKLSEYLAGEVESCVQSITETIEAEGVGRSEELTESSLQEDDSDTTDDWVITTMTSLDIESSAQPETTAATNVKDATTTESELETIDVPIVLEHSVSCQETTDTLTEISEIIPQGTEVVSIENKPLEQEGESNIPRDDNERTESPGDLKQITEDVRTTASIERQRGDTHDETTDAKQTDTPETEDTSLNIQLENQSVEVVTVPDNEEIPEREKMNGSIDSKQVEETGGLFEKFTGREFLQDLQNTAISEFSNRLDVDKTGGITDPVFTHDGVSNTESPTIDTPLPTEKEDKKTDSDTFEQDSSFSTPMKQNVALMLNQDVAGKDSEIMFAHEIFQTSNVSMKEDDILLAAQLAAAEIGSPGIDEKEEISENSKDQNEELNEAAKVMSVADNDEGNNNFTNSDMEEDAGRSDLSSSFVQPFSSAEVAALSECEVGKDLPEKIFPKNNDVADKDILDSSSSDCGTTEQHSEGDNSKQNEKLGLATVDKKIDDRTKPSTSRCLRAALQVGFVALIGVGSAAVTPFALAAAGFEAGGIAAGSVAESLMTLVSSTGYGAAVITTLEAVGSAGLDITTQILIGLLSAGTAGGVVLASEILGNRKSSPRKTKSNDVKTAAVEGRDQQKMPDDLTSTDLVTSSRCGEGHLDTDDTDDQSDIRVRGEGEVTCSTDQVEDKEVTEDINDLDSHKEAKGSG